MLYHWNPTKKGIEDWLDRKIHEFVAHKNRNLWLSKEEWLDCYLYREIHEIFFASFPTELYEWIVKLADSQGRCKLDSPIVWTPKLVCRLKASKDKIACIIDHWLDRIIGGFITEFAVDTSVSYSEVEWHFLKGPRGKYVKSLNTWIKMLLCENQIMRIHWCLGLCEVGEFTETKVVQN